MNLEEAQKYGKLTFLAQRAVEGFITGLHRSPYKGFSVEFAEHKPYNTGESTKNIDWKLYSRTNKLYTKQYEEETNLRCTLVIDVSPSMYYPQNNGKIAYCCFAAAALSYLLNQQRDAVGLQTFGENTTELTPVKASYNHVKKIFHFLEELPKQSPIQTKSDIASCIHHLADRIHKRSLVVVFTDMFDNINDEETLFNALMHLKHNKHEVIIFHVYDSKTELNFEFENRPYIFTDSESNEKVKLNPKQVRELFESKATERKADIKTKCGMAKIDYVDVDINQSLDQVLLPYLLKRSKLY